MALKIVSGKSIQVHLWPVIEMFADIWNVPAFVLRNFNFEISLTGDFWEIFKSRARKEPGISYSMYINIRKGDKTNGPGGLS